jgi:hypothetical protein
MFLSKINRQPEFLPAGQAEFPMGQETHPLLDYIITLL